MKFRISEKYRLEIHWDKVIYTQDGVAKLRGCYLSGPVIGEISEMVPKDAIDLDFFNQYILFVKSYYIASLAWEGIKHDTNKIYLHNATLINKKVNAVPKLNHDDYIVIDTKGHEDEKHQYNLTYPSFLVKSTGELYNFNK
ncbi:MAG: hypothetical protein ACXACY_19830 [Candidatus Hodarchaeales archaeon]|jgi:hypothetical protein